MIVLLFCLFLCVSPTPILTNIDLFHITVRTTKPSLHIATITAATIRIKFNRPLPLFPSSPHGLTQLICNDRALGGKYLLYESTILSPHKNYHGSLPTRLIPVWNHPKNLKRHEQIPLDIDPTANMLLQTASTATYDSNEFVVVFPLNSIQTVITTENGTTSLSRTQTMTLDDLFKCSIRFVHPEIQINRPSISIGFVGDVSLSETETEMKTKIQTTATSNTDNSHSSTTATKIDRNTNRYGYQPICNAAIKYTKTREHLIAKSNRLSKIVGFLPTDQKTCVPMPKRKSNKKEQENDKKQKHKETLDKKKRQERTSPGLTSLAETAADLFVNGEEGMAHAMTSLAKLGVPNLGGVLMIPMKDVSKDFSQLAAGNMADSTTGVMEGTSSGQVDQSMTEQITGILSRGLKARLTETLVPPLKQTLVSSVASSTTQLFQLSLTKVLTKRLERPLLEKITGEFVEVFFFGFCVVVVFLLFSLTTQNIFFFPFFFFFSLIYSLLEKCTKYMPKHFDTLLPTHIARLLSKDLNHLLSRSVPHSIVPALVHTLTHSPMQDYYCFYCYHHKTYCQYCNYAPSQTYYAEFYTGFYSTYYGDYYMDNALRQMSAQDLTRKKIQEED